MKGCAGGIRCRIPRPGKKRSAFPSRTPGPRCQGPRQSAPRAPARRALGTARVVGAAGFEPASPCGPRVLSPLRLPVSSRPRQTLRLSFTMIPPSMQSIRREARICLASSPRDARSTPSRQVRRGRQAAREFDPPRVIARCRVVFVGQGRAANTEDRRAVAEPTPEGVGRPAGRRGVSGGPERVETVGVEAASGFEPLNRGFADLRLGHLATPPGPRSLCMNAGAGNGIRTRDPDLGKVVLYH